MKTIVLSKFPEIAAPLLKSLEKFNLRRSDVIFVRDGHDVIFPYAGIPGLEPFIFSRNANLGIKLAGAMDRAVNEPESVWTGNFSNVLLLNDDTEILQEDFFEKLKSVTNTLPPKVGILGALVDGGVGNPMQRWPCRFFNDSLYFVPHPQPVCFVAVWLKGKMLDQIGLLDESFTGYGRDDDNLCIRARAAGWSCCLSNELWVRHGEGGSMNIRGVNWSKSFVRTDPLFANDNEAVFQEKHAPRFRVAKYEAK